MKNKKPKGIKHDDGKVMLSLLSPVAKFKLGKVMTNGAKVYSAHNWRNGFNWTRVADAAERHLTMWVAGMDKDPDSGESNLAHASACLMMLLEFEETHKHLDDRYKLPAEVLEKLYPAKEEK